MAVRLSQFQLQKLSEYSLAFSQVVLASLILKIFEPGVEAVLDKDRIVIIYSALVASVFFFVFGMFLAGFVKGGWGDGD